MCTGRFRWARWWTWRCGRADPLVSGAVGESAGLRVAAGQAVGAARRVAHHRPVPALGDDGRAEALVRHDGRADVRAGQVEMGGCGTVLAETLEQDADRQAGRGL